MAVYTNDLRLKEIANGDESGTWGTSTNLNLKLIGEALSFQTEAIFDSDGDKTTTVADGAEDAARGLFYKATSTTNLTATRVLTIAPATISRVMFIENATSGSQSITVRQSAGGSNVTIANGQTKAVYLDGAASNPNVVDAFQDLSIPDLFIDDDLTFTSDSAVITFGADGDTTLTHTDGSGLTLNSTNKLMFNDASQFIQGSSATVLSLGATDEIDLTATAIDVNGTIDVSGNATFGGTLGVNSGTTNTVATFTSTDAGSGVQLTDSTGSSKLETNGANLRIGVDDDGAVADSTIQFRVDGSTKATVGATSTVFNEGSADQDFRVESNGNTHMLFVDAGNDHVNIGTSTDLGGVFNVFGTGAGNARVVIEGESSADPYVNFLANNTTHFSIGIDDSDSDSFKISHNSALGTNDRFKIDTNGQTTLIGQDEESSGDGYNYNLILAPDTSLSIAAGKGTGILFQSEDSGSSARHAANINSFRTATSSSNTSNGLRFSVRPNGTDMIETFRLRSDEAVFNENSGNIDFRVESDSDFTAFFVDAGNSRVGINEDAPENALHINGGSGNIPLTIESTDTECALELRDSTGSSFIKGRADLRFEVNSADVVRMESAVTVVNEAGADYDFRVESQHLTHLLFCDGGNSKVGIGQSSPDNRLHVVDSTTGSIAPLVIGNEDNTAVSTQKVKLGFGLARDSGTVKNDAGEIEVGKDNQWDATDNNIDSYMAFATYRNNARVEQMRMTNLGMLCINTTSNLNSGGGTKPGVSVAGGGGGPHVMTLKNADTSGGANQIEFQDGSGDVCGAINSNASSNTTAYGTSSDYRLKENVSAVSGAIEKLKLLEPKTYNFISDSSKTKEDGFLAHELAEVIPNAVTGEKDAVHDNGQMDIQQVDYGKLTPLLTAALQEAVAKIETLETEIAALKGG